jgi:hypothetical protein
MLKPETRNNQAIFQWRIPVMGDREADPLVTRITSALAPPHKDPVKA